MNWLAYPTSRRFRQKFFSSLGIHNNSKSNKAQAITGYEFWMNTTHEAMKQSSQTIPIINKDECSVTDTRANDSCGDTVTGSTTYREHVDIKSGRLVLTRNPLPPAASNVTCEAVLSPLASTSGTKAKSPAINSNIALGR